MTPIPSKQRKPSKEYDILGRPILPVRVGRRRTVRLKRRKKLLTLIWEDGKLVLKVSR